MPRPPCSCKRGQRPRLGPAPSSDAFVEETIHVLLDREECRARAYSRPSEMTRSVDLIWLNSCWAGLGQRSSERTCLQLGHGQSAVTSRLDFVFSSTEGV